jgi:hypothetical protein
LQDRGVILLVFWAIQVMMLHMVSRLGSPRSCNRR